MEQLHRHVGIALLVTLLTSASLAWAQGPTLTVEEKRAFLRSAEVVGAERTSTGATRPWRLILSDGTLTHDAAFQSVDQYRDRQRLGKTEEELNFVDSYRYNIVYCPRVLGQWFDGIRFYAAASSPTRSRRTWAGLR